MQQVTLGGGYSIQHLHQRAFFTTYKKGTDFIEALKTESYFLKYNDTNLPSLNHKIIFKLVKTVMAAAITGMVWQAAYDNFFPEKDNGSHPTPLTTAGYAAATAIFSCATYMNFHSKAQGIFKYLIANVAVAMAKKTIESYSHQNSIQPAQEATVSNKHSASTSIWSLLKPTESHQFKTPQKNTTFASLAGKIPDDIKELPEFITNREQYAKFGARTPKGILLYGPPGTGKTSIARAIAGEAHAAFITASASEFIELYVGTGPQRIRALFAQAEQERSNGGYAHAIIFIDEIDAIGKSRDNETSSEYRNTLNELLNHMDGFEQNSSITVIAATNNPHLDKALLRRFERHIEVPLPDETSRKAILEFYLQKTPYAGTQETIDKIAQKTLNFSNADLELIINEAACTAVRQNAENLTDEHLIIGFEKIAHNKREKRA